MLSEESRLRHLQFDALASLVVILLVELKTNEVALLFYTSNGGGAASHEWVEYYSPNFRTRTYELTHQFNWLLCRMYFICSARIKQDSVLAMKIKR